MSLIKWHLFTILTHIRFFTVVLHAAQNQALICFIRRAKSDFTSTSHTGLLPRVSTITCAFPFIVDKCVCVCISKTLDCLLIRRTTTRLSGCHLQKCTQVLAALLLGCFSSRKCSPHPFCGEFRMFSVLTQNLENLEVLVQTSVFFDVFQVGLEFAAQR